jgi:transmembrane sensor
MMATPNRNAANRDEAKGAAHWALRLDECPILPPAEEAAFQLWLAADPAHAEELAAFQATLGDGALLAAMARFTPPQREQTPSRRALLGGGIAAALAVTLATPLLLDRLGGGRAEDTPIRVPAGGSQRLDLADGSRLTINGGTDLLTSPDSRQVTLLRGETYLEVAAAEGAPFLIDCAAARIQSAVGAFNLDVGSGLTEISVYEGTATVTAGSASLKLARGDRASLEGGRLSGPTRFDPLAGDFRNGWLVTQGLTLAQLAERLNRSAPLPIRIQDKALAGRRVAGRFKLTEPEKLLASLGKLHGFTVRRENGELDLRLA